jgi:hypothetical protein
MRRQLTALFFIFSLLCQWGKSEHLIVCGAPALRKWEDFRVKEDQHDRWWANFVRASTIRMDQIRKEQGSEASLVWMVYQPGYKARGREDNQPYTTWIAEQASKRNARLIWFESSEDFLGKFNSFSKRSIQSFDYFGHSNKHAFMFEYGSDIMAVSTACLHESNLKRLNSSVFARKAACKSWGCNTGNSMSRTWKRSLGLPLIGSKGKTLYTVVGEGLLPLGFGGWTR